MTNEQLRQSWPCCYDHLEKPSPTCAVCAVVASIGISDEYADAWDRERKRAGALARENEELREAIRAALQELSLIEVTDSTPGQATAVSEKKVDGGLGKWVMENLFRSNA